MYSCCYLKYLYCNYYSCIVLLIFFRFCLLVRYPVYLSLPWKGEASQTLCRTIKTLVTQTYFAAHFIPVFTTIVRSR